MRMIQNRSQILSRNMGVGYKETNFIVCYSKKKQIKSVKPFKLLHTNNLCLRQKIPPRKQTTKHPLSF